MSGWLAADPSRRRVSAPAVNAGSLSKQKYPVGNDSSVTKEAMLSSSAFLGRSSGSSRRAAVSSSRDVMMGGETEILPRPRTSEAIPGTFQRVSSAQRSSPAVSGEHIHSSSGRIPSIKNYESALKGIKSLNFDNKDKVQY